MIICPRQSLLLEAFSAEQADAHQYGEIYPQYGIEALIIGGGGV
jgi:hypothetical protein